MATYTNEERLGHLRTNVELQPGERCSFCRCWKSATFPFCDGTHKQLEGNIGPVVVQVAVVPKKENVPAA